MFVGCTQLSMPWKTWKATFETWVSQKVVLWKGTYFMKPLAYVPNECKGLEQLRSTFGMPMKRKGCLERFYKVHPNHAHFLCNCVIWNMPMCAKTMRLCRHGESKPPWLVMVQIYHMFHVGLISVIMLHNNTRVFLCKLLGGSTPLFWWQMWAFW